MPRHSDVSSKELVRVCLASADELAWTEFIRRFHTVIASTVLRTARQWCEPSRAQLDDLIQDGYLKSIPEDPMTHSKETWVTVTSDAMHSVDQTEPGIDDVHSGSEDVGSDGQPYSAW